MAILTRLLRWSAVLAVVVAVALLLAYALLPWLAQPVSERYLADSGVELVELQIKRPGTERAEIEHLVIHLPAAIVELRGVTLEYAWSNLRDARIAKATVASARITTVAANDVEPVPLAAPAWLAAPQAIWNLVPASEVVLNRLELNLAVPRLSAVGAARFDRNALHIGMEGEEPYTGRSLTLAVELRRDGSGRTIVASSAVSRPVLRIDSRPAEKDGLVVGEFDLSWPAAWPGDARAAGSFILAEQNLAVTVRPGGRVVLPAAIARTDAAIEASWSVALAIRTTPRLIELVGPLVIGYRADATDLEVEVTTLMATLDESLAVTDWRFAASWQLELDAAADLVASGRVNLSGDSRRVDALLAAGAAVAIDAFTAERWRLDFLAARAMEPIKVEMDRSSGVVATGPLALDVDAELLVDRAFNATAQSADDLGGSEGAGAEGQNPWRIASNVTSDGIRIETSDRAVDFGWHLEGELDGAGFSRDVDLDGVARIDAERATATLTAAVSTLPFPIRLDVESAGDGGRVSFDATHSLEAPLLATALGELRFPFDLTAGLLTVAGKLSWGGAEGVQMDARVRAERVDAYYDDFLARGVDVVAQIGWSDQGLRIEPTPLAIESIDVGFALTEAIAQVGYDGRAWLVDDLRADVLGGVVTSQRIRYVASDVAADFEARLDSLDLAAILALEGESVTGTGTLDGTLPVRLLNEVVIVENGRITARPPGGVVQYPDAAIAAAALQQQGIGFAVEALTDFNYDKLDVGVDYAEDGTLALAIRLEGRNPVVENGRPIHYNLNITENLPILLESLRIADEVGGRVEKKVNR